MEIKKSEGQTLLTLLRLSICGIAALCIFGMQNFVNGTFDFFRNSEEMVNSFLEEKNPGTQDYGNSYILYYDEQNNGTTTHIYKQYYITGEEGSLGMVDSSGKVIFEPVYEGIILLPHSCILKQDGQWRFYDLENQPLSDDTWDTVEVVTNKHGKIVGNLIEVSKDGLYGATDQQGEVMISPRWDDIDLNNYEVDWPLIRVKKDGEYGFINSDGYIIIGVRYEYATLGTYVISDENQQQQTRPAVFVYRNEDWGAIFQDRYGDPTYVDWDIEPPAEVIEDYNENYAQQ